MAVNATRRLLLIASLLVVILPAAAILSEAGCFLGYCLQFRSDGGLRFFPGPIPSSPFRCQDEGLKRSRDKHVASMNYAPFSAYRDLKSGAFLGDIETHRVESLVAACHTGLLYSDYYFTICRHAERDNDLAVAGAMLSCSTIHKNGKPILPDRRSANQPRGAKDSWDDIVLKVIGITMVPGTYIQYYKWWAAGRVALIRPDDLEAGAVGRAPRRPFHRLVQFGLGFAAIFNDGRWRELFEDIDRMLIPIAHVAARIHLRRQPV